MPNIRANIKSNTDKVLTPTAYVLDGIILTNHRGEEADIQNLVPDFTITESLYTSALILRLNVKDTANFIEEYQLIGQETIRIKMGRHDLTSTDPVKIDLLFYVTEYPVYGRDSEQQNTQAYAIVGVTKHAYVSQFKRISRSIGGPVSDEITRIMTKDLFVSNLKHVESTIGRIGGVLPLMHPLDAAYWLLRRAYDRNSRPFFLHESMIDGIRLESLTSLVDEVKNPNYRTFRDSRIYATSPGTPEYFTEFQSRILDVSSDFKLSKVLPMIGGGAYASNNMFLDLSTKTITQQPFSYKSISPKTTLNGNGVLSDSFGVSYEQESDVRNLAMIPDSFVEYVPINSLAYSENPGVRAYHDMMFNHLGTYNSTVECLDSITHEILVAGDFALRPGRKITLEIPKAIDLAAFDPRTLNGNFDEYFDRTVSGKYLVAAVIHQFGSEYHCRMHVKRDSFTYNLNGA